MAPKNTYAVTPFGSQNRPWRPRRLLDALGSPFGSLLAPFGLHFDRLELNFRPFCLHFSQFWLHFATFSLLWLPFGTLFASFSLLFLILIVFYCFFFIWIACGSVFGRTSNANTIFGHPTPQGTHSKIIRESQTVGTLTFLGPGRACCRRQLKIRPGPEAPEACWDSSVACSQPITHPISAFTLSCRAPCV